MQFYSKYLELCNSIGKSPSRVVLEIGLKKSAVTRWKSGGMPTDATLAKIADYFSCTVEELTEGAKKPVVISDDELDSELFELLTLLSAEEIEKVTAFIQGMISNR